MIIRLVKDSDYQKLAELYRTFFSTHNIFQQSADFVINYLIDQAKKSPLLVAEEHSNLVGAVVIYQFGQNTDGSHKLWKFRHFAFLSEDAGTKLLQAAEDHVKKLSKTLKIELTIAETEEGKAFYLKHGYIEEGVLKDHYRPRENCYILGKSFL